MDETAFQLSMEALKGAGFGLDNPSGMYVMVSNASNAEVMSGSSVRR